MQTQLIPAVRRVDRPSWVWTSIALEIVTALGAIPVGLGFIADPTGSGVGAKISWLDGSVFADYFVPGLYLFAVNGIGMLALAALTLSRHWIAPWLTGALGVGLMIWISVQLLILPETMVLQWFFLGTGLELGLVALFWLRRTGQLRLW